MKKISPELYGAIKAAVLDDQAPAILRAIYDVAEAESDRLRPDSSAKPEAPQEPMAYLKHRMAEEAERDTKPQEPWLWWMSFADGLDYIYRSMQQKIEERPITRGELKRKRREAEIELKRRELEDLQRA